MALKTLSITIKPGETVSVSGPASFKLESRSGAGAKLAVMADESVRIERPGGLAGSAFAQQGTGTRRLPTEP